MVVTFLLVIMSAAVMVLSQRVVEQLKAQYDAEQTAGPSAGKQQGAGSKSAGAEGQQSESISSPRDAETGSSVAELGAILRSETLVDGQERLTIRTRDTKDTLKVKVKAMEQPEEDTKGAEVTVAATLLRVDFEPTAIRYSPENVEAIVKFLKSHVQPGVKYEIWAMTPQDSSISEAQRIGFYRAAITRNVLVKAGIAPGSILTQVRVTDPTSKDGHNVRVVIKP